MIKSAPRKHLPKNKPEVLITQYAWNRPASRHLNVAKCETQSGKKKFAQSNCRILHALYKLRKKRAKKKKSLVQATLLKSRFTLSRGMSHVWPVNT